MPSGGGTASLLLAPHADDESLFAAYTCMRERPHVIVCTYRQPEEEVENALRELECDFTQLVYAEGSLSREGLAHWLEVNEEFSGKADIVYAPAYDEDGHEEHNLVAEVATSVFGERVRSYLTYAPRGHRSRNENEVQAEPWMIAAKLRALSCYQSQIANPATRPWFYELLDMREWVV